MELGFLKDDNTRRFIASLTLILVGVGLIILMLFVDLPDKNADIINMLVGAFASALGIALSRFLGDENEQIRDLKALVSEHNDEMHRIEADCEKGKEALKQENASLQGQIALLVQRLDTLQQRIIDNTQK